MRQSLSAAKEARIREVYRQSPITPWEDQEWRYLAREPYIGKWTLDLAVKAGLIERQGEDPRWYADAYRLAPLPDHADFGDLWIE